MAIYKTNKLLKGESENLLYLFSCLTLGTFIFLLTQSLSGVNVDPLFKHTLAVVEAERPVFTELVSHSIV